MPGVAVDGPVLLTDRSAFCEIALVAVAELFAPFGSGVDDVTVAELVTLPLAFAGTE